MEGGGVEGAGDGPGVAGRGSRAATARGVRKEGGKGDGASAG